MDKQVKQPNNLIESDKLLLGQIKNILHERPTYGYRRVTAVLNAKHRQANLPQVNHKKIYRIMRENQLLLKRHSSRSLRVHDSKVVTLHSNARWCSDGFDIRCDNGDETGAIVNCYVRENFH